MVILSGVFFAFMFAVAIGIACVAWRFDRAVARHAPQPPTHPPVESASERTAPLLLAVRISREGHQDDVIPMEDFADLRIWIGLRQHLYAHLEEEPTLAWCEWPGTAEQHAEELRQRLRDVHPGRLDGAA
ncbi:hypothetical protein D5S17_32930 [Pseudonocardiaceae bacterium YIM PH 21723]|nr:hypothetical protein D5S17_32930 [Pseudonocardiaceae bacterium YIM PH 21723]